MAKMCNKQPGRIIMKENLRKATKERGTGR